MSSLHHKIDQPIPIFTVYSLKYGNVWVRGYRYEVIVCGTLHAIYNVPKPLLTLGAHVQEGYSTYFVCVCVCVCVCITVCVC